MNIRAVVFDIGQTLTYYPIPLNWSALYRPAFGHVAEVLGLALSDGEYEHLGKVLAKYNTRINPRETEVSSDVIFREMIAGTSLPPERTEDIKREFYSFFRADAHVYPEAEQVLAALKSRGIPTATLSDVAYGMDNIYALDDIRPLLRYIDLPWTSNDTGFRKPSGKGLLKIAAEWKLPVSDVAFVGDEQKDMDCARNAGAAGILVNRTGEAKEYGQALEIKDLSGILNLL